MLEIRKCRFALERFWYKYKQIATFSCRKMGATEKVGVNT